MAVGWGEGAAICWRLGVAAGTWATALVGEPFVVVGVPPVDAVLVLPELATAQRKIRPTTTPTATKSCCWGVNPPGRGIISLDSAADIFSAGSEADGSTALHLLQKVASGACADPHWLQVLDGVGGTTPV